MLAFFKSRYYNHNSRDKSASSPGDLQIEYHKSPPKPDGRARQSTNANPNWIWSLRRMTVVNGYWCFWNMVSMKGKRVFCTKKLHSLR